MYLYGLRSLLQCARFIYAHRHFVLSFTACFSAMSITLGILHIHFVAFFVPIAGRLNLCATILLLHQILFDLFAR